MSDLHAHTVGSPCLKAVESVPLNIEGGDDSPQVEEPGWFLCTKPREWPLAIYYVHQHGDNFVAHYPHDKQMSCYLKP